MVHPIYLVASTREPEIPNFMNSYPESKAITVKYHPNSQTSHNYAHYLEAKQAATLSSVRFDNNHAIKHLLNNELLKERIIKMSAQDVNKVFCSKWLNDRQVAFGTRCNKLYVHDVIRKTTFPIPSLHSNNFSDLIDERGKHAIDTNPSGTMLATGAKNTNELAVYRLPTFEGICVGADAHRDWLFDLKWLDDHYLISCSRDSTLALWFIDENHMRNENDDENGKALVPVVKPCIPAAECQHANKLRSLFYNKLSKEVVCLSTNATLHVWDVEHDFHQKRTQQLSSSLDAYCVTGDNHGQFYAVGSKTNTALIDTRVLQTMRTIRTRFIGVRSISFNDTIITMGTGWGGILFYDIRADAFMRMGVNGRSDLNTSAGIDAREQLDGSWFRNDGGRTPALFTIGYNPSRLKLFCGGGPMQNDKDGNYAAVFQ